jgi:hypothetical protein
MLRIAHGIAAGNANGGAIEIVFRIEIHQLLPGSRERQCGLLMPSRLPAYGEGGRVRVELYVIFAVRCQSPHLPERET